MTESFNSRVEVVVDDQSFGHSNLKWRLNVIYRDYGIAVLSPLIPPQVIDLSSGVSKFIDDMEFDLEYIEESKANNETLDKYDLDMLTRYERLKNLKDIEISEFEVLIESQTNEVSSIGLHIMKIEIESLNKKAKVYFSGNSA